MEEVCSRPLPDKKLSLAPSECQAPLLIGMMDPFGLRTLYHTPGWEGKGNFSMPTLHRNASKKAKRARMQAEMHKFKHGTLHSGSKHGPKVTSRAQAVAIGLNESGQSKRISKRHRRKGTRKGAFRGKSS